MGLTKATTGLTKATTSEERLRRVGLWDLALKIAKENWTDPFEAYETKSKLRNAARARRILLATVKWTFPDMSLTEVGALLGLDHTTVMHAIDKRELELFAMYPEVTRA